MILYNINKYQQKSKININTSRGVKQSRSKTGGQLKKFLTSSNKHFLKSLGLKLK